MAILNRNIDESGKKDDLSKTIFEIRAKKENVLKGIEMMEKLIKRAQANGNQVQIPLLESKLKQYKESLNELLKSENAISKAFEGLKGKRIDNKPLVVEISEPAELGDE